MSIEYSNVIDRLVARQYGNPVIRNDLRGELVEEIVGLALEPDWRLCGPDWASHDLVHVDLGIRMQVRQSAARQTWHDTSTTSSAVRYSISRKKGRYEGSKWLDEPGRNADIFLFAWHGLYEGADHRDPSQWVFYSIQESRLPGAASISLSSLQRLSGPASFKTLPADVARLVKTITSERRTTV